MLAVSIGHMDFHHPVGRTQWFEAVFGVQTVCIPGRQQHAPQALQVRMLFHGGHESVHQTLPAVRLQDVDVGQVGKRRLVADHPREAHLVPVVQNPKADRVGNGTLDGRARDARRPIGGRQERVDGIDVKACRVGGDFVGRHGCSLKGEPPGVARHSTFSSCKPLTETH